MHPQRKRRLLWILVLLAGTSAAVGLVLFALRENVNLFYPPVDIATGKAPVGREIRAGGMVVEGSVVRAKDSLHVEFAITDYKGQARVVYDGILPDMFREGQGVVAMGVLDEARVLHATQVLAKHDENYMPAEVRDALEKSGRKYDANPSPKHSPLSQPQVP